MTGRKIEHLLRRDRASQRRGADGFVARDERENGGTDTGSGPDEVEFPIGPQGRDILVPLELDVHGDKEKIEAVGHFLQGSGLL